RATRFPYTTLFRSCGAKNRRWNMSCEYTFVVEQLCGETCLRWNVSSPARIISDMSRAPVLEFADGTPHGVSAGFVASMVGYAMAGLPTSLHRGVPSPHLTLIVNLDTPIVVGAHPGAEADGSARAYDNILGGLHTRAAYLFQPDHQAGIQLAIHPLAARQVFGVRAAELADIGNDASGVLGAGLTRLRDRAAEAPGWAERFELITGYLAVRANAAPTFAAPRPEVVAGWRWMSAHRGSGRMDAL